MTSGTSAPRVMFLPVTRCDRCRDPHVVGAAGVCGRCQRHLAHNRAAARERQKLFWDAWRGKRDDAALAGEA